MREWCTIFLTIGLMNVCCAGVGTVCTYVGFHRAEYFNVSPSVRLLYGESHGVTWSDLALSDRLPPLLNLMYMDVLGLDYHYQKGYLFYSGWGQIWRLSINEPEATSEAMVVVKDSSGASSVAVDWVRDRVYWTSPGTQTVHRATLEGSERAIVVTNTGTLNNYSNIVLDPYTRLLFLAVDGASFIRTDLEGGDRTNVAVIGHSDKKIVSLALDTHQRRVYVSARHDYLPQILSCEYDGTGAMEYDLTEDWWNMISSIGVYRGQLFWTHHGWRERDSAWKANVSFSGALSWEKEYTARGTVLDPETISFIRLPCQHHTSLGSVFVVPQTMKCQVLLSIVLCVLTGVVRCIPEAKYLGCFDIAYSLRLNYHHHISDLTLGKCLSTCKILHTRYAGVEKSDNFCYCGGDIFEESAKKPELLCNVECPDQPDLTCGGSWLISLYDMEKNESQTPSLNTSVGLLIGISSGVRLYNTSSIRTFDNIMSTSEWAYSVDYHLAKNLVFVISSGKLLRSTLDGKTSENALTPSLVKTVTFCEALAVDWVHDKILWAKCGQTVMIMSMDMASGNDTILVQREGDPKSIRRMEVDPYRGMVFWTADGTIESCELTGDNFQTNVSLAEVNVRAMALDLTQRRVYYVGTSNRSTSLFRMNYDGSDHREHFINMPQIKSIYGLSIVEGVVYWVNYGQRDVVYQAPLTLTEPSEVLLLTTIDRAVWHMRVIHPSLQSKPKRTACMEKGCSHICVNQSPTSVQCQCPRGLLLDQDGVSCHEVSAMGTSASRSELATAPAILIMAAAVGVIASLLVFLTDKYWSHLRAKLIAVPYTRESSQPVTVYDTTSDNVNLI